MQISAEVRNLGPVVDVLRQLSGPQAKAAYAKATNDTAYQVRLAMQAEMRTVFNAPTPYILKSSYVDQATPDRLSARVAPENKRDSAGVDPQKILQAQEFGGRRRDKRSEVAFRRAGLLPAGWQMAIPASPYPGSDDGRGNLRGAFVAQLISYFQASAEQGYRANMKDKRKANLRNQQGIGNIAAKKVYKTTLGRRYFISLGRLRGHHLAAGIWAASGTHDVEVKPVVMFVRAGTYTPRLSMERVAAKADIQNYMDRRVRFRIREAAGV